MSSQTLDNINLHKHFFKHCLQSIPSDYITLDSTRLTLLHFAIHALDLIGCLDEIENKQNIINWIYNLQVTPNPNAPNHLIENCGFRGSSFFGRPFNSETGSCSANEFDQGHIAMTYTALVTLKALNDDLSRVNKDAIIAALRLLQQPNGTFSSLSDGSEADMRFLFCACAISSVLDDWSGIDMTAAYNYVSICQSYDGGIALIPGAESHGGSTYCAIASLYLMGKLSDWIEEIGTMHNSVIDWCLKRQSIGFQGRTNKDPDSCYSFWIGASLNLLGYFDEINIESINEFLSTCSHPIFGGFSKYPETYPDILHSFYSICWLSMTQREGFNPLHCGLGVKLQEWNQAIPKK